MRIEKDFEIGKYPVTNGWFREFVEAKGYENEKFWTPEGQKWLAHTGVKAPLVWHDRKWNNPSAPVVGVCWYEAMAFLNWLTSTDNEGRIYRLPTETEWEAAAAGMKGEGEYPWRGDWKEGHCNSKEAGLQQTSVVGVFPDGNTPDGVVDMAGNVWEWTVSDYHSKKELDDFPFEEDIQALLESWQQESNKEKKDKLWNLYIEKWMDNKRQMPVLRGGSWDSGTDGVARADRDGDHPGERDGNVGLRWARTFRC